MGNQLEITDKLTKNYLDIVKASGFVLCNFEYNVELHKAIRFLESLYCTRMSLLEPSFPVKFNFTYIENLSYLTIADTIVKALDLLPDNKMHKTHIAVSLIYSLKLTMFNNGQNIDRPENLNS